jgi:hypothetical protein
MFTIFFELIQFQKMWKLAVALAIYVLICIVYRILPSFDFELILVNGINVGISHTCNTMRV